MKRLPNMRTAKNNLRGHGDWPPTSGEHPKMRAVNREQLAGNSQFHVISIEPAKSGVREEPTSEKQEPNSKWAVNSKDVTPSSKLSIANREQRRENIVQRLQEWISSAEIGKRVDAKHARSNSNPEAAYVDER